jgi:hypothetical protein
MAWTYQIAAGNQSVVITANDEKTGPYWCRVYVNVRASQPGDATTVHCTRKTIPGAFKWARQKLGVAA